jgi:hypothetical protein
MTWLFWHGRKAVLLLPAWPASGLTLLTCVGRLGWPGEEEPLTAVQNWEWRRMMRQRGGGGWPGHPRTRWARGRRLRAPHKVLFSPALPCSSCKSSCNSTGTFLALLHLLPCGYQHLPSCLCYHTASVTQPPTGPPAIWSGVTRRFSGCSWRPEMSTFSYVGTGSGRVPLLLLWPPPFVLSLGLDGSLLIATIQCFLFSMI